MFDVWAATRWSHLRRKKKWSILRLLKLCSNWPTNGLFDVINDHFRVRLKQEKGMEPVGEEDIWIFDLVFVFTLSYTMIFLY